MAFDETRKCSNCLFRFTKDDQLDRCRFNAPYLKFMMKTELETDWLRYNNSVYPPCPGPACGQWQTMEEPEIIIEPEQLPRRIDKDED